MISREAEYAVPPAKDTQKLRLVASVKNEIGEQQSQAETNPHPLLEITDQSLRELVSGCPCVHVSFVQTKLPSNILELRTCARHGPPLMRMLFRAPFPRYCR
jgi:hypothetical protein